MFVAFVVEFMKGASVYCYMVYLWDYDKKELEKTESGRIKILERMINYGPGEGEKIKLSDVKKYWNKLDLHDRSRRLFELLIWGKYKSFQKSKRSFWIK
jgi:hypothetical protein